MNYHFIGSKSVEEMPTKLFANNPVLDLAIYKDPLINLTKLEY